MSIFKKTLGVIIFSLATGLAGCPDSPTFDPHQYENELRKQMQEKDESNKRKVREAYEAMDAALREKNLTSFVLAYEQAVEVEEQLSEDKFALVEWFKLDKTLNEGMYGGILLRTRLEPKMLDQWPASCSQGNDQIKTSIDELVRFRNNRSTSEGHEKQDKWQLYVIFDDETLSAVNDGKMPLAAIVSPSHGFTIPGKFAELNYDSQADFFAFSLYNVSRKGVSNGVQKYCDVLDLGADGIDGCDARLNFIEESQIRAANRQYRNCLTQTLAKLKGRYKGSDYFKKTNP